MAKTLKIVSAAAALFFLTIILLALAARLYFSDTRIKGLLENYAGQSLDSRATIDSLTINGWLDLDIRDLKISEKNTGTPWLVIEDLRMSFDPFALLSARLSIDELIVSRGFLDYSKIPAVGSGESETAETDSGLKTPLDITLNRCRVNDFEITGPEADFAVNIDIAGFEFSDLNDFSSSFGIIIKDGLIHYLSDSLRADGSFEFDLTGHIASEGKTEQKLSLSLRDLMISIGDTYPVGDIDLASEISADIAEKSIAINNLRIDFDNTKLIEFSGLVDLKEPPKLDLKAREADWKLAKFDRLVKQWGIPLDLRGDLSLEEAEIRVTPSAVSYDFTLALSNIETGYSDQIRIDGINGRIFSSGDMGEIIFGSSLDIDSVTGTKADGSVVRLRKISTAIETEITDADFNFNITSGISDFMGGAFDLSAFSQNSRVQGELKAANLDLAEISSRVAGRNDTSVFGIFNLTVDLSGVLDSINARISARADGMRIVEDSDTLSLGTQNFTMSAITIIRNGFIDSKADYRAGDVIVGKASVNLPIQTSSRDSLVFSFDLDIDNALIPGYLPPSLISAVGALDLSGQSALSGRFASSTDSVSFRGTSSLTIKPTDILIEDFQSLFSNLVGISEVKIDEKGVSISSNNDIGELYAENYSDITFPMVNFSGEIISSSDTTWRLTNAMIMIPSIKTSVAAVGEIGYSQNVPFSNITLHIGFESPDPVRLAKEITIDGAFQADLNLAQTGDLLSISGGFDPYNVNIVMLEEYRVRGISGHLPIRGEFNLAESLFVGTSDPADIISSRYIRERSSGTASELTGQIDIQKILAGPIVVSEIGVDIAFENGVLRIPDFSGTLLGGNFSGQILADFGNVNLMREFPDYEKLKYRFAIEMTGLDFNRLVNQFGPYEKKAEFSADASFAGRGIIAKGENFTIDGNFHISEMGSDVANRILDVLDPDNQNPGVTQTRSLMNRKFLGIIDLSYRPDNFSFELKHGSVYPRLFMDQPFFAEAIPIIRIPMPIEYGRIPLKTILNAVKETSW